jgi:hypothetical protein
MPRKDNFIPKNILYNPQRDRALSTSKKKVRNGGIGNYFNPPKIGLISTQSKVVIQISFGKKVSSSKFDRGNSARKISRKKLVSIKV